MRVLAFDTALSGCSAAYCDFEKGISETAQSPMIRGQSEALVPMVQDVIARAGAAFTDIDLVVTSAGPGAFTGLRIGLASAKAFALALGRPVCGLITLDVLAQMFFEREGLEGDRKLCVLIETKRSDYYCRFYYADGSPASSPEALEDQAVRAAAAGFEDVIYIGDALARFDADDRLEKRSGFTLPDPAVMARMGAAQAKAGTMRDAAPLYLRGADVSAPKNLQREILG